MGAASQKKKIMSGMPVRDARKKLREIFSKAHPGVKFDTKYPGIYPWMEAWYRLRSRSETFDIVAQSFAEKVAKMHKQMHALEQTIHLQRAELAKLHKAFNDAKEEQTDFGQGPGIAPLNATES